jgi:Spy/CpxP family protein refolding chaperone
VQNTAVERAPIRRGDGSAEPENTMRKTIFMGLGLALTIAGTAAAQQGNEPRRDRGERAGDQRGPGMRGQRGGPDGLLLKGIELNEGQRAQIAQLQKAQRDSMQGIRDDRRAHAGEMRAARQRGDTAAARAIMQRNRQGMEQERAQHIAAIRNILTAEQRVQFDKNVAELQTRDAQRPATHGQAGQEHRGHTPARGGKPMRGGR